MGFSDSVASLFGVGSALGRALSLDIINGEERPLSEWRLPPGDPIALKEIAATLIESLKPLLAGGRATGRLDTVEIALSPADCTHWLPSQSALEDELQEELVTFYLVRGLAAPGQRVAVSLRADPSLALGEASISWPTATISPAGKLESGPGGTYIEPKSGHG